MSSKIKLTNLFFSQDRIPKVLSNPPQVFDRKCPVTSRDHNISPAVARQVTASTRGIAHRFYHLPRRLAGVFLRVPSACGSPIPLLPGPKASSGHIAGLACGLGSASRVLLLAAPSVAARGAGRCARAGEDGRVQGRQGGHRSGGVTNFSCSVVVEAHTRVARVIRDTAGPRGCQHSTTLPSSHPFPSKNPFQAATQTFRNCLS